jgi:hypothetical protein
MSEAITVNQEAEALRERIYNELEGTSVACFALEQSWTRLGVMLTAFKAKEYWRQFPELYTTFDDFMSELKTRFRRGRTQLYGYMGAVEALLPSMPSEQIEAIGISKALELKRALKKLNGKPLPEEIITAATSPTVTTKELRGDIGRALNLTEEAKGSWFDLDGFYMDAEERAEFKEAFLATEGLLGLKPTTPDHIRRKEVFLTWMREWWGTHAADFSGQEQPPNAAPVFTHPFVSSIPKDID